MANSFREVVNSICCGGPNRNIDNHEGPPPQVSIGATFPELVVAADSANTAPTIGENAITPAEAEQLESNFEDLKLRKSMVWKPTDNFNEDAWEHPEAVWCA